MKHVRLLRTASMVDANANAVAVVVTPTTSSEQAQKKHTTKPMLIVFSQGKNRLKWCLSLSSSHSRQCEEPLNMYVCVCVQNHHLASWMHSNVPLCTDNVDIACGGGESVRACVRNDSRQ